MDKPRTSALRRMTSGGIALLGGLVVLLSVAYRLDVADPVDRAGPAGYLGLLGVAAIVVAAGFSFVRALAERERSTANPDLPSILLVTIVTVGSTLFAIGGVFSTLTPDKRFHDPTMPYTFSYPGGWERDPPQDLPPHDSRVGYMAAVSKQVATNVTQGVLVYAFQVTRPWSPRNWARTLRDPDERIYGERRLSVSGQPALQVDFGRGGPPSHTRTVLLDGRNTFVIECITIEDFEEARKGCEQVLETFRLP